MYIIAVYGNQGKPNEAEKVVREAGKSANELPQDSPIFIVGDFNLEWGESDTMWDWKVGDKWTDLYEHHQLMKGEEPGNTTEKRRIDFAWGNRKARAVTVDCWTQDIYATHSSVIVELRLKAFTQSKSERVKPRRLLEDCGTKEIPRQKLDEIKAIKTKEWEEAEKIAVSDKPKSERREALGALADIWSERAERSIVAAYNGTWRKRMHQRGRIRPIRKMYVCKQITVKEKEKDGGMLYNMQVQAQKIMRRLDALAKNDEFNCRKVATWDNARHGLIMWSGNISRHLPHYLPKTIPGAQIIKDLKVWLAKHCASEHQILMRKVRKEDKHQNYGSKKYKKVTAKPTTRVTFVGGTCDVEEIDKATRDYWAKI